MNLISLRRLLLASALTFALSPSLAASIFSGIDTNNDGATNSASITTGTLTRAELRGRIPEQDWKIANPDNDKTVSKEEYLKYVEYAFKRADTNGDGTVNEKEARTPAGEQLLHLLR
jgi:hypothetical protein